MKIESYLVVNERGTTKITKNPPSLNHDEICLQLNLDIPNKLFKKPLLTADIKIPDGAVSSPTINATVIENIEEEIRKQVGVHVQLTVVSPEEEDGDSEVA